MILLLVAFPIASIIGCLAAEAGLKRRVSKRAGYTGMALAVVGGVFPGAFIIAPLGILLAIGCVAGHLASEASAPRAGAWQP